MDTTLKNQLDKIHSEIKGRFVPVKDLVLWKMKEHWEAYPEIPETGEIKGDCDCFALACRKECRKLGIPSRLVFCMVGKVGHLVLESEGWILCNIQEWVRRRDDLDYEWIKISGYEMGDPWHELTT